MTAAPRYNAKTRNTHLGLGALFGATMGVIVGLMFAPRSGSETRGRIKDKAKQAKDMANDKMARGKDKAADTMDSMADKAADTAKSAADKAANRTKSVTDRARSDSDKSEGR